MSNNPQKPSSSPSPAIKSSPHLSPTQSSSPIENWSATAAWVRSNPEQAVLPMADENNKHATTILHKALTSKTIDSASRISICKEVLRVNPNVAGIKNYHGSLPLHLAVRNSVKMDSNTKQQIIDALIQAFSPALTTGDAFNHTPLHVACEKWCSAKEAKILIDAGPEATNMRDEKGCLPIHIACSRRCSPDKLKVLLDANPDSIDAATNDGDTPLAIATLSATKKHPNTTLISILDERLERRKKAGTGGAASGVAAAAASASGHGNNVVDLSSANDSDNDSSLEPPSPKRSKPTPVNNRLGQHQQLLLSNPYSIPHHHQSILQPQILLPQESADYDSMLLLQHDLDARRHEADILTLRQHHSTLMDEIRQTHEVQSLIVEQTKLENVQFYEEIESLKLLLRYGMDQSGEEYRKELEQLRDQMKAFKEQQERESGEKKKEMEKRRKKWKEECRDVLENMEKEQEEKLKGMERQVESRFRAVEKKQTDQFQKLEEDIQKHSAHLENVTTSYHLTQTIEQKRLQSRLEYHKTLSQKTQQTHLQSLSSQKRTYQTKIASLQTRIQEKRTQCEQREMECVLRKLRTGKDKADAAAFHMIMFLKGDVRRLVKRLEDLKGEEKSGVEEVVVCQNAVLTN